jgi:hypothetical protein
VDQWYSQDSFLGLNYQLLQLHRQAHCHIQTESMEMKIPQYHLDKHWNDMTRVEKRAYKRWMNKHQLWDGAEVIERLQYKRLLVIG